MLNIFGGDMGNKTENGLNINKAERTSKLQHWQRIAICLAIYDFLVVNAAYFLALYIRFDAKYSMIPTNYLMGWVKFIPIYSVISLVLFQRFKLYKSVWSFASYTELRRITIASFFASLIHITGITLLVGRMPIFYYIVGSLIQYVLLVAARFSYRFVGLLRKSETGLNGDRIMLIGAGKAGHLILRDVNTNFSVSGKVVCIIDDNKNKWGRVLDDVPIVGGRDEILHAVEKYKVDSIFIAIPSASPDEIRDILTVCHETNCEIKNLPGLYQFVEGEVFASALKEISVEDLLGRDPIKADMHEVFSAITGKTVLVTGGGGSIGSELCRQVAGHNPKQLIIFDIYENNAYDIQLELRERYPQLNLVTLIGSVRDGRKMNQVFETYHPDIVYHAAAHKHVPLMEDSPCETIKNNVIGTYKTAYAAMINGCDRFVLISTDKAVNPTNIMGASKRLCEMVTQAFDAKIKAGRANEIPELYVHHRRDEHIDERKIDFSTIKTQFVAVRFGNVLGSNGSVIPIFKKQIEKGGPVTVTHPEIIRYFMTIPEAVSLVMLAGTYAQGGEIFILDMGSPVKIDNLARNLIRLSGFRPDVDIKIEYTGLRPGEKLYEEKLMAEEGIKKTDNNLIHVGCPIPFDKDIFFEQVDDLMEAAYQNVDDMKDRVAKVVLTYHRTDKTK